MHGVWYKSVYPPPTYLKAQSNYYMAGEQGGAAFLQTANQFKSLWLNVGYSAPGIMPLCWQQLNKLWQIYEPERAFPKLWFIPGC
jgi:hypothetical protein